MSGDIQVNQELASRLVHTQFPELDPIQVAPLGEGCDSVAFEVNGGWVFRFPKRPDVEQQLLIETKLLRWLTVHGSPIPLPAFSFHGRPSESFPFHFAGYSKLPGMTANRVDPGKPVHRRLAAALGRFLSWLHAFSATDAMAIGVPDQHEHDVIADVQREALEDFPVLARVAPDAPLDRWRAFLEAAPIAAPPPPSAFALVHNDLAAEHVLVDESAQRVTGVIDWSDAAIGDRAIDFAGIFHWGGAPFMNGVLANYDRPIDEHLEARARFFAAGRGVLDVQFGLERNDREYVEGGLRALSMACSAG
jgi:aminoglycoside phosphotransferase (APT) family kinase protein